MQSGFSLSLRNMTSMVVIVTATSMVTSLGAVTMAAHEILRQVWIISIQAFMALDICAQSMVASFLGQVSLLANFTIGQVCDALSLFLHLKLNFYNKVAAVSKYLKGSKAYAVQHQPQMLYNDACCYLLAQGVTCPGCCSLMWH